MTPNWITTAVERARSRRPVTWLTLVGVLLLGVILNLLNLEGTLSPWWQWVIRGAFLLVVVVVHGRAQRAAAAADV